jgi:hypothetical protein
MPWNESTRMDERRTFAEAYLSGQFSMTELCRGAGVSRPTGYCGWIATAVRRGRPVDRSCPASRPHRTPAAVRSAW